MVGFSFKLTLNVPQMGSASHLKRRCQLLYFFV